MAERPITARRAASGSPRCVRGSGQSHARNRRGETCLALVLARGNAGDTSVLETLEGRRLLAVVNGLTGAYFHRADLTDPAMKRVDATVNFDWGSSSPASNIQADTFSVRWTGQVQAKSTGLHTFYTSTDDGVRLWVNNQLLINRWRNRSATEYRESISLVADRSTTSNSSTTKTRVRPTRSCAGRGRAWRSKSSRRRSCLRRPKVPSS